MRGYYKSNICKAIYHTHIYWPLLVYYRKNISNKIKTRYKPICNSDDFIKPKPDYVVRSTVSEKFSCPCCGAEMKSEKILEKSTLYRCTGCGISDTKLNC